MPTNAPVKELCSPPPASSDRMDASRTGPIVRHAAAVVKQELKLFAVDADRRAGRGARAAARPRALSARQPPVRIVAKATEDASERPNVSSQVTASAWNL